MSLPVRIQADAGSELIISVDGAWDAPGLNLSHWPGNKTPKELKHELSTGIALNFRALDASRRAELSAGCVAIANNHYDTDGICSQFVLHAPQAALGARDWLLEAARAGDFYQMPSERGLALNATIEACADSVRSPWRSDFAGCSDLERHNIALHRLMRDLPNMLAAELSEQSDLWRPELERVQADAAELARCTREELVHLDLEIWTATTAADSFDPGRHALFGSTQADRILVAAESPGGTTYRFLIGTLSWFDLGQSARAARPDLDALAAHLNELEGTTGQAIAWRAQSAAGASPELWFGTDDLPAFSNHARAALRPSALAVPQVKSALVDALRAVFVFPEQATSP